MPMTESLVGKLMIASTVLPDSLFSRSVCLVVQHDENGAIGMVLNRPVAAPPQGLLDWMAAQAKEQQHAAAEEDEDPSPTGLKSSRPASARFPDGVPAPAAEASYEPEVFDPDQDSDDEQELVAPELQVPAVLPVHASMVHFGGPVSGPIIALHGSRDLADAEAGAGIYVAAQREHLEKLVKQTSGDVRLIIGHAAWTADQLAAEITAGFWHLLPATPELVLPTHVDLWPQLLRRATGSSVAFWLGARDTNGLTELN